MALRGAGGGSSVDLASPGAIGGTTPAAGTFTALTASALFRLTGVENAITAFATGGQASATALSATKNFHRISVCATAADSVKLPAATAGQMHFIRNDGAAAAQVFGTSPDTINGVATGTGVSLSAGWGAFFLSTADATWVSTNPIASASLGANTFTGLQTITQAAANAGIVASTGYSLTGSDATNMIDLAGTLNTSGSPSIIKANLTNTASGAGTSLLDFQLASTNVFNVSATRGSILMPQGTSAALTNASLYFGTSRSAGSPLAISAFNSSFYWLAQGQQIGLLVSTKFALNSGQDLVWTSSSTNNDGGVDLTLRRATTATLQQGAANAASPVAQTLQAQGSRSGTDSNVAGASYTLRPGAGTGDATPGALILQSYVAVASGTGAQTATETIRLVSGYARFSLPTSVKSTGGAAVAGNAVLVGGAVTVNTTAATATCIVILTRKTSGGTLGTAITYTISAGTSFTITSDSALDTSTFSWQIVETF